MRPRGQMPRATSVVVDGVFCVSALSCAVRANEAASKVERESPMHNKLGLIALAFGLLAWHADTSAHFKLLVPTPWVNTNELGDPQKVGPCGGDPKGANE